MLTVIARYEVTKIGSVINGVQKEIGMKKKVFRASSKNTDGCLLADH